MVIRMTINIPEKVNYIIQTLIKHGFEAYAVGGCIRDTILGFTPEDWDITTSAKPEEVKALFPRTIDTGIQHGTITILLQKEGFEVTTYRIDGDYEDGRHPKNVAFTNNLIEDLRRRDFTINAMAYNSKDGIVDAFDGMKDLSQGIIKCVGNPDHRFHEDALRMLRAIRFSGQLGFSIEEKTKDAITRNSTSLSQISAERVRSELDKLLRSPNVDRMITAYKLGITKIVLPEFDAMITMEQNNPHYKYTVGTHALKSIEYINIWYSEQAEKNPKLHSILCWTLLLHDVGKTVTKTTDENGIDHFHEHANSSITLTHNILERLKFDNYTIQTALWLIQWHDYRFTLKPSSMRRALNNMLQQAGQVLLNKTGLYMIELLFLVQSADISAQSEYQKKEKLEALKYAKLMVEQILETKACLTIHDLDVNGRDLIAIGITNGKEIGNTLKNLLDYILEHPEQNQKELLLSLIKNHNYLV